MRMNKATLRLILVFSAYIIFTGMLQVTLPSSFAIWGAKPDLLLVLAVLSGYMFGQRDGIIVGLAAGFFRDIMAGRALGLGMLLLMYSALFASFAFRRFFRRNFLMGLAQVAMVTVLYQFVITCLQLIVPMLPGVSYSLTDLFRLMINGLPSFLLVNILAGIPMIFLLNYLGPYQRGSRNDDPDDAIVGDSLWQVK